jgi:Rad3-related DNA helicase
LTYRNKVKAPPSSVQKIEPEEGRTFPYTPYPQQHEFMRDIREVVGGGGVLVAEACNGFGKTVCALASILPMDRRIVYATRTHEQVRQVLREVERINRSSGKDFSAVNLASRQHLCLNEQCRDLSAIEAVEACRLLRETGQCPYKRDFEVPPSLPSVLSIRGLRTHGRARRRCPYFLARKAAENCTVIVAPYQYIFNENIRARVKLELNGRVLVFDEAHNADQIGQDALSDTLSERVLDTARRELDAVHVSSTFIDGLAAYLDKRVSESTVPKSGLKLKEELQQVLGVDAVSSFADDFSEVVEEIRSNKLERGDYPVCFLNGVLSFLKHVDSSPAGSYVAIYRRSIRGFNLLEYRCLDPSLAIQPVVEEAAGALIMSGTLSPLEVFTEILGLNGAETRAYSAIADPKNVRTIIDSAVTTRFAERGEAMTRRYGQRLSRLVAEIPHGVLIFFPQRRLMLECLTSWRRIGVLEQAGTRSFLSGKPLFVEGAQATANRKVVEAYKTASKREHGAVLCGVFRGRNAEGSNFPYDEARGVVLIGVPYADFSDPVVKAQMRYLNGKRRGLGDRWYSMDAFRAANQAMGRGIRHRDDWCNFILMDRRYATHQKLISQWAVVNGVHQLST